MSIKLKTETIDRITSEIFGDKIHEYIDQHAIEVEEAVNIKCKEYLTSSSFSKLIKEAVENTIQDEDTLNDMIDDYIHHSAEGQKLIKNMIASIFKKDSNANPLHA